MFKDSRRFQRLSLNTGIKFQPYRDYAKKIFYENKEIEAQALDISEGGLGIQSRYYIPEKTYLSIWISLSSLNREGQMVFYGPMELVGRVAWVVSCADKSFRIGIYFVQMLPQDKKVLADFINSHTGFKANIVHNKEGASGAVFDKRKGPDGNSLLG